MSDPYVFTLELDREDKALLEHATRVEKLSKAEVMRRALRGFAKSLPSPPLASSSSKKSRSRAHAA